MHFEPVNPFITQLTNWVYNECCKHDKNIEIEAKLGLLLKVIDPSIANLIQIRMDSKKHHFIHGHSHGYIQQPNEKKDQPLPFTKNENNEYIARVHKQLGIQSLCIFNTNKNPFIIAHQTKTNMTAIETTESEIPEHTQRVYFDSSVSQQVFIHFNKMFNAWVTNSRSPSNLRIPELRNMTDFPSVTYSRTKEIDKIYFGSNGGKDNVRVTLDIGQSTNESGLRVKECIQKCRQTHMNICSPQTPFDIRISASLENTVPLPMNRTVSMLRCKDRISYMYDIFSIDISCIHTYTEKIDNKFIQYLAYQMRNGLPLPVNKRDYKVMAIYMSGDDEEISVEEHGCRVTYEVEFEIANKEFLVEQRKLRQDKKHNKFEELVYYFAQTLIRLSQMTANLNFVPMVCRLPAKK